MLEDYQKDEMTGFLVPKPLCPFPQITLDQKKQFLARYSESFNMSKAARLAETSRALITLHLREDKAFKEAFEATREEVLDSIEESLYKQSKKSPLAAMKLLQTKRPDEWGGRKKEVKEDKTSDKLKKLLEE